MTLTRPAHREPTGIGNMTSSRCNHWIWVSDGKNPSILHTGRLQQLTSSLNPEASSPSVSIVIDSRRPTYSTKTFKRSPGILCLDLDQGTADDEPMLLASMDLPSFNCKKRFRCCPPKAETLLGSTMSVMESQGLLYSRLLYPFVDLFCFHSYSLSDLVKIARWIATWPSQDDPVWQPSIMVLLHDEHLQQPNAAVVAEQLLAATIQTLTSRALSCYFFDSNFIEFSNASPSIQGHLRQHIPIVRQRRRDSGLLLSAEHMSTLFERAFESAATLHQQPFDPVRSARRDLPVSADLTGHLVDFMSHLPISADLLSFASSVVASSLLCDHYLPDMHCEFLIEHVYMLLLTNIVFNPQNVFKSLYQDACVEACKQTATMNRSDGLLLPSSLANSIRQDFTRSFDRLRQGERAVSVHRATLKAHSDRWKNIKSNKTCFSCLTQIPQHKISCGHWICENCVQAFGKSEKADPYLFSLTQCLLDGEVVNLVVRIRPPTAGHSILCIDGGGIRGIIPPAILQQVQERLNLPIPVQEFFTLAYGVSAGMSSESSNCKSLQDL